MKIRQEPKTQIEKIDRYYAKLEARLEQKQLQNNKLISGELNNHW